MLDEFTVQSGQWTRAAALPFGSIFCAAQFHLQTLGGWLFCSAAAALAAGGSRAGLSLPPVGSRIVHVYIEVTAFPVFSAIVCEQKAR